MKRQRRKWFLGFAIVVFALVVLQDMWLRPGLADLKGGFEEVSFIRNEQNKGGVVRIYAFSVKDTNEADYLTCGDQLAHNDYGSVTKAYFFASGEPMPELLQLDTPHFDTRTYRAIAVYKKGEDGIGRVSLLNTGTFN